STKGEDQREFGKSYLFLAPGQAGTTPDLPRTAFRDDNLPGEIVVDSVDAFPANTTFEVAVVVDDDAQELRLYLNAKEERRTTLTEPLAAIEDVNNWLGRSQFSADSRFGGSFLEFRIYDRALTPGQLAESVAFGASPAFLAPAKPGAQDGSGAP
ncbi:MAG TPA: LamG domain-containing protein, partial [Polyangiaceae bacterium]|nr:LamG domain-containing protein [Polyangiaceae bacterium]